MPDKSHVIILITVNNKMLGYDWLLTGLISDGNRLVGYNSGSYQASDFKSDERQFEITSTNTPELYDTKSYYQLIVSLTKCEQQKLKKTYVNKSHLTI